MLEPTPSEYLNYILTIDFVIAIVDEVGQATPLKVAQREPRGQR